MTNDNKQQKHSDSTEPAIDYSTCCAPPILNVDYKLNGAKETTSTLLIAEKLQGAGG